MPTSRTVSPDTFLPLTPVAFDILVTLATASAHGYAILTDVRERTGAPLRPGSLYRALNRLLADGLVEEAGDGHADKRTSYTLTALGRRVAEAEAARLNAHVRAARDARLLKKAR